jgi:ElaB/YqjD/DUF883 family membrane-anchored ribosome-binding protein
MEQSFQATEEALTTVTDKASELEADLEEVVSQTEDYLLNDFNSDLETHQSEIDETTNGFVTALSDRLPEISTQVEEFTQHIEETVQQLTEKLQDLGETTGQSAQDAIDQISQFQNDGMTELLGSVNELSQTMEQLGGLIETTTQTVVTTKDTLVQGAESTNLGLGAAVGIFEDLVDILQI